MLSFVVTQHAFLLVYGDMLQLATISSQPISGHSGNEGGILSAAAILLRLRTLKELHYLCWYLH